MKKEASFSKKHFGSYFFQVEIFKKCLTFSGFKPNVKKCERAGSEALKKVKEAVCGMKSVDLGSGTIKILEMFSPTMKP